MTRRILASVLAFSVIMLMPGTAHATNVDPGLPTTAKLSGVIDHGPVSDTTDFGTWRNKPIDTVVDYLGGSTWASIEDASWMAHKWDSLSGAHIVLSMFMLPTQDSTANMHDCAATLYNSHYVAAGNSLVAAGYANATIRLGWENTGSWFPKWGYVNDNMYYYGSCWRNEVKSLRQATGQHFTFDWNISDQHIDPLLGNDPSTCFVTNGCGMYPGDSFVDVISGDFYDNETSDPTQHIQSWENIQYGAYGLNWLSDFAAAHGKRMAIPEWGVEWKCAGTWMGGDDPYYVYQMSRFVASHDVVYQNIFNDDDSSCQEFSQASGKFPTAFSLYRYAFGNYNGEPTS